jgi:LPS export ABC transporter protein LptC
MEQISFKLRSPFLIISALLLALGVLSCENKIDSIPKSELLNLPTVSARDFMTVVMDSGKMQLVMSAPLIEKYDKAEFPYSEFRMGIKVVFHDGKKVPVGSVTSKYAKYTSPNNLWELRDSVIVLNESGDKLETEVLFWNQESDKIYTDRFVKITNTDQTIQGFGFESDSHLQHRKIRKVSAIIYFSDEE